MNPKVKAFIENAQEKQQIQTKQERDKLLVSLGLTDGVERKYVDEVGAMNMFFKFKDALVTPPLLGSILGGITRDSIIQLAKKMGTGSVLINLSGRGDKDMDYIIENYGIR